ncbi:MAG: methylmalonyl-CoA epimerase [Acidobacteriota bacterium]|nr:MAG: methylmalonyl-CoA epimerase [Acidobacteriota bacterium]
MSQGRILGIDHLGIAVRDPVARLRLWTEQLGLSVERVHDVRSEAVRTWFLPIGESYVELLEPLASGSPMEKFLSQRGEGLHHVCLRTDDLGALLARLREAGIEPVGGGPRPGAGGAQVAFLHPRDVGGVLIELTEGGHRGPAHQDGEEVFGPETLAVVYLRDPREQHFGVLKRLDAAGIALDGLAIQEWDRWIAQWSRGETGPLSASLQFFPASRLEKIVADRDAPELASMARQFFERTGRALRDVFDDPKGAER